MIKKLDVLVLILLPILAVFASLSLRANFLLSTILFYGLPAVYLSWRNPHAIKRALVFSLIFPPLGFVADYLAVGARAWFVPHTTLPRLLGVVPLDDLVWEVLLFYAVVMFYEHFLDKGKHNMVDRKLKYLVYAILVIVVAFLGAYFFQPGLLVIPYVYFTGGAIIAFIPLVVFLSHYPRFLGKYMKVAVYFICVNVVYELTALELGQWVFPGKEFLGWVELLGYRFPFEEFFFYIVLMSVAILSYFEYFDDNKLKKEARRYT